MIAIPPALNNKEISSFIEDMISSENAKDFYSLDEIHQDEFVSLGLKALNHDIDICLSHDGNISLAKYLLNYDKDEQIELKKFLIASAREKFSCYFDQLLEEKTEMKRSESMYNARKKPLTDQSNGETLWI